MIKTIILRDEKLESFKKEMNLNYDYILLELDYDNQKASYIVEDAVRFNIDFNIAESYS